MHFPPLCVCVCVCVCVNGACKMPGGPEAALQEFGTELEEGDVTEQKAVKNFSLNEGKALSK